MKIKIVKNEINTLGQRASLESLILGILPNIWTLLLPAAAVAPVMECAWQYRPELYRQEKSFMVVHGNKLGDRK